jgi:enolase-phosphatase E1
VIRLADHAVALVLLDIEGTTTPIAFVHDVLFPFARAHLAGWLIAHHGSADYDSVMRQLAAEHEEDERRHLTPPPWPAAERDSTARLSAYVVWLMDQDRKSPALKRLQGLIWEGGYQSGALRGEVYPDVPVAMRRWRGAGIRIAIYSSGSELAQRRLFASVTGGDLTPLIDGFFDTAIGAKTEAASYTRIAAALGVPPRGMCFISDAVPEVTAAREAGCQVLCCDRAADRPPRRRADLSLAGQTVGSFDEIR